MEISNRLHPQSFQANFIPISNEAGETISKALRNSQLRKEVSNNLDEFRRMYPRTLVTLNIDSTENCSKIIARNTENSQKIFETITNKNEPGNAFAKLLSKLISPNKYPEISNFWNSVRKEF